MPQKNQKDRNRPIENRKSIFENNERKIALKILQKAKNQENLTTHKWIIYEDKKTRKLVKI